MKSTNCLLTFLLLCLSLTAAEPAQKKAASGRKISVTDFGAIPNDSKDDTGAFQKALQEAAKRTFGQRIALLILSRLKLYRFRRLS